MVKEKKKLEQWQLDDAARLRMLINNHISERGISQMTFMQECGYSQSLTFQLCGSTDSPPNRPLNYDHVAIFAEKLGVTIETISPTLARRMLEMCKNIKADGLHKLAVNQ